MLLLHIRKPEKEFLWKVTCLGVVWAAGDRAGGINAMFEETIRSRQCWVAECLTLSPSVIPELQREERPGCLLAQGCSFKLWEGFFGARGLSVTLRRAKSELLDRCSLQVTLNDSKRLFNSDRLRRDIQNSVYSGMIIFNSGFKTLYLVDGIIIL